MTDISLFEAIRTQRAIRQFTTEPVPDKAINTILEAATRAPSASNRQPWYFLVIRDPETKRRIGEWYRDSFNPTPQGAQPRQAVSSPLHRSANALANHIAEVPVLIFACIDHGTGRPGPGSIMRGADIYPAVQNLLLAARGLGLGTVLTTIYRRHEAEIKEFLGIPENVETVALIPVGYPAEGERFGGSRRKPVAEVTFYDRWGQKGRHKVSL